MKLLHTIATAILRWNYWEEIEKLKKTPLYADGRYDRAVAEHREFPDRDIVQIAHTHFDPEYNRLSYVKKAELLTNIDHCRVDTIAH